MHFQIEEYISALLSLRPIHDLTAHTTKILTEAVVQQDSVAKYLETFFSSVVAPVVERNLLVFSETFGAFVLPHCVDPNRRDKEVERAWAQIIASFDRYRARQLTLLGCVKCY